MTASLDHNRLVALLAVEETDFSAGHPRSRELSQQAQAHLFDGVPMNWMTRWASPFPLWIREAHGASRTCVDGHDYIDFCLGDTGAMTGHSPRAAVVNAGRKGEHWSAERVNHWEGILAACLFDLLPGPFGGALVSRFRRRSRSPLRWPKRRHVHRTT